MAALTCLRSVETSLTLTCPSPKSFVCNLPDSGRHVTSVFQSLFLSRSAGRVGENPGNEVVPTPPCWQKPTRRAEQASRLRELVYEPRHSPPLCVYRRMRLQYLDGQKSWQGAARREGVPPSVRPAWTKPDRYNGNIAHKQRWSKSPKNATRRFSNTTTSWSSTQKHRHRYRS